MDPEETWNSHVFLDSGEYFMNTGLGIPKPLQKGTDCPDYATYFSATFYHDNGTPIFVRPQLACLFERTLRGIRLGGISRGLGSPNINRGQARPRASVPHGRSGGQLRLHSRLAF